MDTNPVTCITLVCERVTIAAGPTTTCDRGDRARAGEVIEKSLAKGHRGLCRVITIWSRHHRKLFHLQAAS